jgi:hypothetical protein
MAGAMVVGMLTLTSCASIPTAGPVREGAEVRSDQEQPFIRTIARPPRPGMTPTQIVNGFLEASASFDSDHEVAREYLAPEQRTQWDPSVGAVVYDSTESMLAEDGEANLTLTGPQVASISERREYTPAPADAVVDARFLLRLVGSEWRIAELPQGLLLTELDVERAFRPFDLYFLDPSESILVPNQVVVPERTGIGATLVAELLRGPTDWLAPAVVSAFPEGADLAVDSVPVEDGIAQVDLTSEVLEAGARERQALSAQLVWTLRQLPDVTGVRITVQGVPLQVPGAPTVQTRATWERFDPNGLSANSTAYGVVDGRLTALREPEPVQAPGPAGSGEVVLNRPAISPEEDLVAGLSADAETLFLGRLEGGASLPAVLAGTRLNAPSWDALGTVWTVDRGPAGPVIWTVGIGGQPVAAAAPEIAGLDVTAFRIARDGARAAVVTGGQIYLARVIRGDGGFTVEGLRPIAPAIRHVIDVSWYDADRVLVTGDSGGVVEPFIVSPGGSVARLGGVLPGLTTVTGVVGRPVLAGTTAGLIWQLSDTGWQEAIAGRDPAYPG